MLFSGKRNMNGYSLSVSCTEGQHGEGGKTGFTEETPDKHHLSRTIKINVNICKTW